MWSSVLFFFSWVCFRFWTVFGNATCHQLSSSMWHIPSHLFRTLNKCQLLSTADRNLGDTDGDLKGPVVVNNTEGSIKLSVLFSRASCVPESRAASERPTSRPALCVLIAQRGSRWGTFNGSRGEHMDNISLRRRLLAESIHLRWQPARRTGCDEQACGQREEQGGWTGSASGCREGGKWENGKMKRFDSHPMSEFCFVLFLG